MRERSISLGAVLSRECVGVEGVGDGLWHLWFGPIFLGRLQTKVPFSKGETESEIESSKPLSRPQSVTQLLDLLSPQSRLHRPSTPRRVLSRRS